LFAAAPVRAQDGASEAAIRAIVADQVAAWNAGDGAGYARHVSDDVSFTNLFGMVMYGAPAFTARHREILATFYKGTTKRHHVRRIRFVTRDVAIVDIDNEVAGVTTMPAGIAVPADGVLRTQLMEVFARRRGRWVIEAYHNVDVKPSGNGGDGCLTAGTVGGCASRPAAATDTALASPPGPPRPAVIAANEGERRFLRGGAAPLLIKVDPLTTGSTRMVVGSSDLPPGDAIRVHRHFREDEIILITRGTGRVQLGNESYAAGAGSLVFIPQGTCIALENTGADTLSNVFVFSAPGFERVLRAVSTAPGEAPRLLTPAQRAAAFHEGHAEAGPSDC